MRGATSRAARPGGIAACDRIEVERARDRVEHQHARIGRRRARSAPDSARRSGTARASVLRVTPRLARSWRTSAPMSRSSARVLGARRLLGFRRRRPTADRRCSRSSRIRNRPACCRCRPWAARSRRRTCRARSPDFIRLAMKSPSSADGSHSPLRFSQAASSISAPSGVACTSLNSPIWRWNATFGSASL